jgi:hypothetical protein
MRVFVHVPVCLTLACLTVLSPRLAAQAVTLHEQQRISFPEPYGQGARDVCLHGTDLLAIAVRAHPDPFGLGHIGALLHFEQQANGSWQFVRELAAVQVDRSEQFFGFPDLDCEGSLAAFSYPAERDGAHVIEFTSSGLLVTLLADTAGASHVDVHRGAIAIGGSWRAPTTVAIVRRNAAGQWADVAYAIGNPGTRGDAPEITGPNDLWMAPTEIGATGDEYEPPELGGASVSDVQIFDLSGGSWRLTTTLDRCCLPGAVINDRLALGLEEWTEPGDVGSYFVRDTAGAFTVQHALLSDEHIFPDKPVFLGDRVFARVARNAGEIVVFQQEAPRRYRHSATLAPSDFKFPGTALFNLSVDGNRVAAATSGITGADVYLFQVPATLPKTFRLERSFSGTSTAEWSFSGRTDWSIVSSGGSRVFRQIRTDAWARAVLTTFDGRDQSIEADVRIHELAAPSAGAGFLLRYTDLQNYYYLLVRRNSLQVGKIVNGVFEQITTAPLSLVLGRTYRLRLEAIGSRLRAFVNGAQVVEAIDDAHARGMTGLTMFRARTDYDNVVVTSRPLTPLLIDDFKEGFTQRPWTSTPANAWSIVRINTGNDGVYRQALLTGTPRAVNGGPARDQVVSAIVRPQAFNAGVRDAFVGLMARHVDDSNHYYVALFRDRAALRKRVNGVHSSIKEVPFAVVPGVAYRVRLEAIGSSLRLYINDTRVAEGHDATLATGRYGLITFNATADFDTFRAVRP